MKKFFAICLAFLFAFACISCAGEKYIHPDFETEYTVEEHVERIRKRTEERYAEEIESGELVHFEVEIVYAFYDDDPEYFLVEFEYAEETIPLIFKETHIPPTYETEIKVFQYTKYKHLIGFIHRDKYYTGLYDYIRDPMEGRSIFDLCGYSNAKKYYGNGVQAVEIENGEILRLFSRCDGGGVIERELIENPFADCFAQKIISEDRFKSLMENNYKPLIEEYIEK